jgi:outer membrane autotransporter protein
LRAKSNERKTDVRTELGARFDDLMVIGGMPVIPFGRLAWAHDFVSNPSVSAALESLPGSNFIVNGAPVPQNSALTSAGAQFRLAPHLVLLVKFDGDFASRSQTYAGNGVLRYTW